MQARPPEQCLWLVGTGSGGEGEFLVSGLSPVVTFDPLIGSSA